MLMLSCPKKHFGVSFFVASQHIFMINKFKQFFLVSVFLLLVTGLVLYKVIFIANMSLVVSFWTIYGLITTFFLISRLPYAYLHKDEHQKVYPNALYPNVSVIIAAKNEEKGIFKT
ncbi:MAG: hypothetical protein AAB952_00235, partial [Patescibacteria group bacterium]